MKKKIITNINDFTNEANSEKIKKNKIKGSVTVEFEMTSEFLDKEGMIKYMKNQMEKHLTEEWQSSHCYPIMKTFKVE